jgi:hypothetical protein
MREREIMDRRDWLPPASAALGSLVGAGAGLAVFWLQFNSGAYEAPGFAGLGEQLTQQFGLPILGGAIGMMAGYHVGNIVARNRRQPPG